MNTINYVIKVTQAQVFAASTKIWQMRLVEQLAVWHIPLLRQTFKANFCTVDVLINIGAPCWGGVFEMGSH